MGPQPVAKMPIGPWFASYRTFSGFLNSASIRAQDLPELLNIAIRKRVFNGLRTSGSTRYSLERIRNDATEHAVIILSAKVMIDNIINERMHMTHVLSMCILFVSSRCSHDLDKFLGRDPVTSMPLKKGCDVFSIRSMALQIVYKKVCKGAQFISNTSIMSRNPLRCILLPL